MESDASDFGLGATLRQEGKAVAYISRLLKKSEKNYLITEKETLACLWAMEKFEYWLAGTEFDLVTDHQPLLKIKEKHLFGTARIVRWQERLDKFTFKVIYRAGKEMHVSDALSKSLGEVKEEINKEEILRLHGKWMHRKSIKQDLQNKGILITNEKLREVLDDCRTCKEYEGKRVTSGNFVETDNPGQIVSCDIMEITRGRMILNFIDYFSRFGFSFILGRKDPNKILDCIKQVNKELKIGNLKTVCGLNSKTK